MSFNENASQLSKARWAKVSPEDRKAHAQKMSKAYWETATDETKKAHMARARAGRKPKNP